MDSRLLTTRAAAQVLDLGHLTLNKWRTIGKGPLWIKMGGAVRYRRHDLEAYIKASRVVPAEGR